MRNAEQEAAATILRILVNGSLADGDAVGDPSLLLRIAGPNEALLRVAGALRSAGVVLAPADDSAVAAEQDRVADAFRAAREIAGVCTGANIPFLFPKILQHYPDLGDDLDLLVLTDREHFARSVLPQLTLVGDHHSLASRIAGSAGFLLFGCATPLDVQHGRLGRLGEHRDFPRTLYRRRRSLSAGGLRFDVPSPDDHLVLQGMQRVYGRRKITLADLAYAIRSILTDALDWDSVLRTARTHGVGAGLSCYLTYADDIHRAVFGGALLPRDVRARLRTDGWGRVEFRGGYYRYPTVKVASALYALELGAHLRARRWTGAGRIFLLPALGAAAAFRRIAGVVSSPSTRSAA